MDNNFGRRVDVFDAHTNSPVRTGVFIGTLQTSSGERAVVELEDGSVSIENISALKFLDKIKLSECERIEELKEALSLACDALDRAEPYENMSIYDFKLYGSKLLVNLKRYSNKVEIRPLAEKLREVMEKYGK